MMPRRRRPVTVFNVGTEPDPRFSLANERTALAWMRTGLSVIAAGVALAVYAHVDDGAPTIHIGSIAICLTGAIIGVWALERWRRVEVALRLQQPLPAPELLFLLPLAVIPFVALILAVLLGVFRA